MNTTESRPPSFRRLLESGFDLDLYPPEGVPTGRRRVTLEASAWHKTQPALVCYFLDLDSERRFRITVFQNRPGPGYGPDGVDFSSVRPGTSLTVELHQNGTGTFRILGASLETGAVE